MAERVATLRSRVRGVPGGQRDTRLPVHPALAALLPGGALQAGSVYAAAPSNSLLMLLLAGPSRAGSWCSVVGMPGFGLEAAAEYGIDLTRLALVPAPGAQWLHVVATLADTMPVVAVRPPGTVRPAEAARLAARLRRRGSLLIAVGRWPQAAASLTLTTTGWSGLGRGRGRIARRAARLEVCRPGGRTLQCVLDLPPDEHPAGTPLPPYGAAPRPAEATGARQAAEAVRADSAPQTGSALQAVM